MKSAGASAATTPATDSAADHPHNGSGTMTAGSMHSMTMDAMDMGPHACRTALEASSDTTGAAVSVTSSGNAHVAHAARARRRAMAAVPSVRGWVSG